MFGIREGMLMVGERMMLCARAGEVPAQAKGSSAAIRADILRRICICILWFIVDHQISVRSG
jgi:hypothetical protein